MTVKKTPNSNNARHGRRTSAQEICEVPNLRCEGWTDLSPRCLRSDGGSGIFIQLQPARRLQFSVRLVRLDLKARDCARIFLASQAKKNESDKYSAIMT